MRNRTLWRLLALLLSFTLIAAACGDDDEGGLASFRPVEPLRKNIFRMLDISLHWFNGHGLVITHLGKPATSSQCAA